MFPCFTPYYYVLFLCNIYLLNPLPASESDSRFNLAESPEIPDYVFSQYRYYSGQDKLSRISQPTAGMALAHPITRVGFFGQLNMKPSSITDKS